MKLKIYPFKSKYHPDKNFAVIYQSEPNKESRKLFKTNEDAQKFMDDIRHLDNLKSTTNLDALNTIELNCKHQLDSLLSKFGVSLYDICYLYKTYIPILKEYNEDIMKSVQNYIDLNVETNKDITIYQAIDSYIKKKSICASDIYRNQLNSYLTKFKNAFAPTVKLRDITKDDIEKWKLTLIPSKQLKKSYAPISTFNIIHAVETFFNFWKRIGYVDANPVKLVDFTTPRKLDPEIYSFKQITTLLYTSKKLSRTRLFLIIALFGGLRSKEILEIKWKNISREYKDITLDGSIVKTNIRRIVRLPDNAMIWLEPYFALNPDPNALVLGGLQKRNLYKYLDDLCNQCAIKRIRNGLRHTAASFHLRNSENATYSSEQLGNSPIILKTSYWGLVSKADTEAFYKLLPKD